MADRFQEPLFSNELDDTEVVYHSFGGEVRKSDSRVHDHPIPVSGIISCTGFVAPCGQRQAFYTLFDLDNRKFKRQSTRVIQYRRLCRAAPGDECHVGGISHCSPDLSCLLAIY